MGGMSITHWIIVLIIFVIPLALIGGIVWLIVALSRRSSRQQTPVASAPLVLLALIRQLG